MLVYRLSEAARVTVRIAKQVHGRRVRFVKLSGKLTDNATVGRNELSIKRRFAGRKLAPGAYRMTVVARDAAGNVSTAKRLSFGIKG